MPNILDAQGLQTATRDELVAYFTTALQAIYGSDINLDSSTPDGQWMNIMIQAILDLEDLLVQIYNTFDPDNAIGNILDQRVAINGIQRQAGTFTITNISIVTSQSVNLYGLDQTIQDVYTVADNAGNQWQLQTTQLGVSIGTNVFAFQAAVPGAQLTIPNTIDIPVTIVLGVTSINNPTSYTTLGINEETDAELKIRRQKSVSLASQGYLSGLLAALENINGVTSAFVYENTASTTNVDGVPGHSIWVIVAGTGADAEIAQAIYTKRNAGCGMFGTVSYTIIQVDGSPFVLLWDVVVTRTLFIRFTASSINGVTLPNIQTIRNDLPADYIPGVFTEVDINGLATVIQQIDSNCLVTNAGFSLGTLQLLSLSGVPASGTFKVHYNGLDSAAINWNDAIGVVQSKIRAVTGLSLAVVTGSLASQLLTIDLTALADVATLISTNTNSLMTSGPVAITITNSITYTPTLSPPSKKNQLVISSDNIYITAMQLLPMTVTVLALGSQQFNGYGGYGAYTYSIQTNLSGGSINSTSGLYTAGPTNNVIDVVKVTDVFGNTATANVTVA